MNTTHIANNKTTIILTTGIYDLLKEQIRKRRLTRYNEEKLELELKNARQVLNRDLPADVVTVSKLVTVTDLESGQEHTYKLVAPEKARRKHNTTSILSPIGLAMVGYSEGSEVNWNMPEGNKKFRISKVDSL
ncbi:MAG: GreA/GreB family elongation factor [Pedobacter sp.]|nr:MAG: GreA/GreB family elongation factor [Pedobacter sp.]